jgi:hypothetical protein
VFPPSDVKKLNKCDSPTVSGGTVSLGQYTLLNQVTEPETTLSLIVIMYAPITGTSDVVKVTLPSITLANIVLLQSKSDSPVPNNKIGELGPKLIFLPVVSDISTSQN